MAPQIREEKERYVEALKIYEEIVYKLNNNKIASGQILSYPTTYSYAVSDTLIFDIIQSVLATKSFGVTQQTEPVNGAVLQWVITNSPNAPLASNYNNTIQSYYDFVALYDECIEIFSNKVIRPKLGQKYAFQNKYYYAFNAGLPCDDVISILSQRYNNTTDNFTQCQNQGDYYQNV